MNIGIYRFIIPLYIVYHISYIIYHISYIIYHISYITAIYSISQHALVEVKVCTDNEVEGSGSERHDQMRRGE